MILAAALPIQEIAKSIPDIIKQAQSSTLGVIALAIIAGTILIGVLFFKSKDWARVTVILAVLVAVAAEVFALVNVPRKTFWLFGKLENAANKTAISGATVRLEYKTEGRNISEVNQSDSVGAFMLDVPDRNIEPIRLSVDAIAFKPFSLNLGGNYSAIPNPISLSPLADASERRGQGQLDTLPVGNVTLYDGFRFSGQSTFDFGTGQIRPWGENETDIGVANPPPGSGMALLFLNNDSPPYTNPTAKQHVPANAGIIPMTGTFDEIKIAPTTGYQVHYFVPVKDGLYCVRTHDGKHFAKIRVSLVSQDRISFDYVFQPNGSRNLTDNY